MNTEGTNRTKSFRAGLEVSDTMWGVLLKPKNGIEEFLRLFAASVALSLLVFLFCYI